jgi:hypothetical protein
MTKVLKILKQELKFLISYFVIPCFNPIGKLNVKAISPNRYELLPQMNR